MELILNVRLGEILVVKFIHDRFRSLDQFHAIDRVRMTADGDRIVTNTNGDDFARHGRDRAFVKLLPDLSGRIFRSPRSVTSNVSDSRFGLPREGRENFRLTTFSAR